MAKNSRVVAQQFYNETTGTYANQLVTFLKKSDKNNIRESRGAAYQDLTPAAFALYIFASLDEEKFPRVWAHKTIENWCGMPYSTYRKAITELTSKKYIDNGNFYLDAGLTRLKEDSTSTSNNVSLTPPPLKNETHKREKSLINDNQKREKSLKNESSTLENENQKREVVEIMKPNENGEFEF